MAEAKLSPAAAAAKMFEELKAKAVKVEAAKILVDKKTLVGKPFIITAWTLVPSESKATSKRSVVYAEVKFVTQDGNEGVFRDSSMNGIKRQLLDTLGAEGTPHGVWHETPIFVPEGIISRTFDAENGKGESIKSTTHTLSV